MARKKKEAEPEPEFVMFHPFPGGGSVKICPDDGVIHEMFLRLVNEGKCPFSGHELELKKGERPEHFCSYCGIRWSTWTYCLIGWFDPAQVSR